MFDFSSPIYIPQSLLFRAKLIKTPIKRNERAEFQEESNEDQRKNRKAAIILTSLTCCEIFIEIRLWRPIAGCTQSPKPSDIQFGTFTAKRSAEGKFQKDG